MQFFSKTSLPWSTLPAFNTTGWSCVMSVCMAAEDFGELLCCSERALVETAGSALPVNWLQ